MFHEYQIFMVAKEGNRSLSSKMPEREREREGYVFNNFLNKTCQDIVSKKMYNAVLDRIHLG